MNEYHVILKEVIARWDDTKPQEMSAVPMRPDVSENELLRPVIIATFALGDYQHPRLIHANLTFLLRLNAEDIASKKQDFSGWSALLQSWLRGNFGAVIQRISEKNLRISRVKFLNSGTVLNDDEKNTTTFRVDLQLSIILPS